MRAGLATLSGATKSGSQICRSQKCGLERCDTNEMDMDATPVTSARPSRRRTLIAWFAANALDAVTTAIMLEPTGVEGNPLPAFILARSGAAAFWAFKAFGTLMLPLINVCAANRWPYLEGYAWKLLWFSTAVVVLAAGWNLYWIVK